MNSVLVWLALVTVVSAIDQVNFKISPQKSRIVIDKFGRPCVKSANGDADSLVAKVAEASLPRDDATNEFLYCFALGAGYIQEDGHINVDGLAAILGDHPLKEDMKIALRKCNEITKENHIQTVVAMNDCISETAPVRFVFNL